MKQLLATLLILTTYSVSGTEFSVVQSYSILKFNPNGRPAVGFEFFTIPSRFAHKDLASTVIPRDCDTLDIIALDYYYTRFRSDSSFIQSELDQERFDELQKKFPSISRKITSIPVRFFEQTLAKTPQESKFYFHGFVVHYRVKATAKNRQHEINIINQLFRNNFEGEPEDVFGEFKEITGLLNTDFLQIGGKIVKVNQPDTQVVIPRENAKHHIEKHCSNDYKSLISYGPSPSKDSLLVYIHHIDPKFYPGSTPPPFTAGMFDMMKLSVENQLAIAKKNKLPHNSVSPDLSSALKGFQQDSIVIVIDITGSMTEAMGKTLKWIFSPEVKPRIKGVVLFNDGNGKNTNSKVIGETGGIYVVDNLKNLQKELTMAMGRGSGGDRPENDLEALLVAQQHFGHANYILVADNNSAPRDLVLLPRFQYPINLLVCNNFIVIEEYLAMIRDTKGQLLNNPLIP